MLIVFNCGELAFANELGNCLLSTLSLVCVWKKVLSAFNLAFTPPPFPRSPVPFPFVGLLLFSLTS
jgi:hypothetical protein